MSEDTRSAIIADLLGDKLLLLLSPFVMHRSSSIQNGSKDGPIRKNGTKNGTCPSIGANIVQTHEV